MSIRSVALCALFCQCSLIAGCGHTSSDSPVVQIQPRRTITATPDALSIDAINTAGSEVVVSDVGVEQSWDIPAAGSAGLDEFLADDDTFALIVRPQDLAESPALSVLGNHFSVRDQVGGESSDMEWVGIFGPTKALELGHEMENITIVARTVDPVDLNEIADARFPNAEQEIIQQDGVEWIRLSGVTRESLEIVKDKRGRSCAVKRVQSAPSMALHQIDSQMFIVCAEDRLTDVLTPSEPGLLAERLGQANLTAPVVLVITEPAGATAGSTVNMFVPELPSVLENSDAITVHFQPDAAHALDACFYAAVGQTPASLASAVGRCRAKTTEVVRGFLALAPEELRPVIGSLGDLLDGATVQQSDESVRLTIAANEHVLAFYEGLAGLLQPRIAAR